MKKTTKGTKRKIINSNKKSGITPLVSVIMPVYNTRGQFFYEAISSILSQTYKDFELLIVDDFSDSYVQRVATSYTDKRIKYYRLKKHSGASAARNYAIERAKGEYIAFLDSDDIALPDRLKKQVDYLEQNPQTGCLGTATQGIGVDGSKVKFNIFSSSFEIELFLIFNGCAFCQSSIMVRKSVLKNNNIRYQTKYNPAEDYGLFLDLIGHTQFYVLPEVLTQYRSHPDNISHRQRNLQRKSSGLAQFNAFKKYCNMDFKCPNAWINFLSGCSLNVTELSELERDIPFLIETLNKKDCPKSDLMYFFKKKFKRLFYKTKTIKGQWILFNSTLNKFFNLSFNWRLMCFITRGIL